MSNEYYDHNNYPVQGAQGSSAAMRAELDLIEAGFNKLPVLTGNGNKLVKINAGGTGLSTSSVISEDGTDATITGDLYVTGGQIGQNSGQKHTIPLVTSDVFALIAATQTLLNKTINLTSNTLTGTLAQFNTACSDADFVGLASTQTITNKTLDLASNTLTGTLAQFNTALSDADFVGLASTQTLTNKTINLSSNTLTATKAQFNTACSDGDFLFVGDVVLTISDAVYGAGWNGSLDAPSKNAVYDKIESILDGQAFTGDITVPDEAYGVGWNGSLEVPTKNAVYDKIESIPTATITIGTPIATTSGTAHPYTSISSAVKKMTLAIIGVSTNGTSIPIIQLGDSGGYETTGYNGTVSINTTGVASANHGVGVQFSSSANASTNVWHGELDFTLADPATNTWSIKGTLSLSNTPLTANISCTKALSATLDRLQLTTVGGANTFTAGSINLITQQ